MTTLSCPPTRPIAAHLIRCIGWLLTVVVAASGAYAQDAVTLRTDVAFLDGDREERLDVYLPPRWTSTDRRPGVVWIHGGGWVGGDKAARREVAVCRELATTGFVVVSVNYRMHAGAWPGNLEDCREAVRFLRAQAEQWGVDPMNIGVAGASAGGHLALMTAYTEDRTPGGAAGREAEVSSAVDCVVNLYGITDLRERRRTQADGTPTAERRAGGPRRVFGSDHPDADVFRLASPVEHVGPQSPPTLILHGNADTTVDRDQATALARVLEHHHVPHQILLLDGIGHSFDLQSWRDRPLPVDVASVVVNFLFQYLGLPPEPVARVETDAVTIREVVEAMRQLRSRYADPAELRQAALAECLRFLVTKQIARQFGLIDEVQDVALRQAFAAENERRTAAGASGTVFYGPRKLSWAQFRAVWLDRLQYDLARRLTEAEGETGSEAMAMRQGAGVEVVERAVDRAVASARVEINERLLRVLSPNTALPTE